MRSIQLASMLVAEVSPDRAFRPLAEGGCPFLQH